jgi:hypothetical protein
MDIKDVKKYIRQTARQQVRTASKQMNSAPRDFESFRLVFAKSLMEAGASEAVVEAARREDESYVEVFDAMWEAWENISAELVEITDSKERNAVWRELKEYYVNEAVKRSI